MNEPSTYFIRREIPEPDYTELPALPAEEERSTGDYWRAIARHKRLILALLAVGLLGATAVVQLMSPAYIASSTILIDHKAPKIDLKPPGSEEAMSDEEADNYYGTQYKILQSRSLALRVIQDLGLQDSPLLNPPCHWHSLVLTVARRKPRAGCVRRKLIPTCNS